MKRTVEKTYNPNNITPKGKMVGANNGKPILEKKVVTTPNKVKTINYGPMDYYSKQEKTKSVVRKKPTILSRIKDLF